MPALLSVAESRGWWRFDATPRRRRRSALRRRQKRRRPAGRQAPTLVAPLTPAVLDWLTLAPRVIPPADPGRGRRDPERRARRWGGRRGRRQRGVARRRRAGGTHSGPGRGSARGAGCGAGVAAPRPGNGDAPGSRRSWKPAEAGRWRRSTRSRSGTRSIRCPGRCAGEWPRNSPGQPGWRLAAAPPGISSVDPDARLAVASPAGAPGDLQARIAAWLAGR